VKFRCERDALAEAVSTTMRAVASRTPSVQALGGVKAVVGDGVLKLTGSDMELAIETEVPVQVEAEGTAVLPRLLGDIVRLLESGAVTVEVKDDEATVSSGRSEFQLRLLPADQYPRISQPAGEPVEVPGPELADALRRVVPAASRDDHRMILTGVQFESESDGLRLVATDSYRLAMDDLPGQRLLAQDTKALIPARALSELQRILGDGTVAVTLGEREVSFVVGATRLTTRLIEGDFPNYRQLLPSEYPNRLTIDRERLAEAVKRVRLMGRDGTPVRLSLSADGVELSATAQDVGHAHESVDADYQGDELTVAFNPEFLLDGILAAGGEQVVLDSVDALKPATLRSAEGGSFLYLLMPVRVS
jgi:DNA polymerase III subunit beta